MSVGRIQGREDAAASIAVSRYMPGAGWSGVGLSSSRMWFSARRVGSMRAQVTIGIAVLLELYRAADEMSPAISAWSASLRE
jgi:hypothetical protein